MTWAYENEKRKWFDTEIGKFFEKSSVSPRIRNIIMKHFLYQYKPHSGSAYLWKMEGTIKELELIAKDKLPIAGIGKVGTKDLQEALDIYGRRNDDDYGK